MTDNSPMIKIRTAHKMKGNITGVWRKLKKMNEGRESMQRKKRGRKNTPIRYVVEHVYSGTESMEGLLTVVSEEAARRNVEKRLRGNMETEKKAV